MANERHTEGKEDDLRKKRREKVFESRLKNLDELPADDVQSLIQDLHMYQVELEMQNEELRRAQEQLEESRSKYSDLYDFAPVGYFTLDLNGLIKEVNLTGAGLLRAERHNLLKKPFVSYIDRKDYNVFYSFRNQLLNTSTRQVCELRMLKKDGATFYARLEGMAMYNGYGNFSHFRIVAIDVTEHKFADEALQRIKDELEVTVEKRTEELKEANQALRAAIIELRKREEELRKAKEGLELRNLERTRKLTEVNEELKKEIVERKRAEEVLKEKELLLKEIHHRMQNSLQVTSSLLNLQSRSIKDKKAREKFKESQNRVKSMALIHEKLYQSGSLAEVDFSQYVKNLSNHLLLSYGLGSKVKVMVEVDSVPMNIDKAIPCGLIINEIVSNSLKYAFADGRGGEIYIALKKDGGNYILTIGNNGIPFPKGVDFRKTESLGLQLVCALVDQLKGTIELHRGNGTEFKITFLT
jgi:PAS domain S-box-containing protein